MADKVLIQFREDKELKEQVSNLYEQLGLDLPTVFRIFMRKSLMVQGIPFDVTLPNSEGKKAFYALREQAATLPDMSLNEINNEIIESRRKRKENT